MKIMANSIPKSGTHMLMRLLRLLGVPKSSLFITPTADSGFPTVERLLRKASTNGDKIAIGAGSFADISRTWLDWRIRLVREGAFFGGHCVYTPDIDHLLSKNRVQMVGIVRDPRDVAVSYANHVKKDKTHFLHEGFIALPDDHERLLFSITGGKLDEHTLRPLGETYREFLRWGSKSEALLIRFEDLVGEKGGGQSDVQRNTIERVSEYLNLDMHSDQISSVQKTLFGVSGTFREGQIGGWERELSREHVTAVQEELGDLLSILGYE